MVGCWHCSGRRLTLTDVTVCAINVIIFSILNHAICTATVRTFRQNKHLQATPTTFTVNKQDMQITIGVDDSFAINASAPVKQPVHIQLFNDDTRIATVIPIVTMAAGTDSAVIEVNTVHIGSCTININVTNFQTASFSNLSLRVHVRRSMWWSLLTGVTSWLYTVFWTVHLLPQVYLNYQRKSVVGLSFDYLMFATTSYSIYAICDIMNFGSTEIQDAYMSKNPPAPGVQYIHLKDVVFSIINLLIIITTCLQCFKYERGDQKTSDVSKGAVGVVALLFVTLIIIVAAADERLVTWIIFFHVINYLKLAVTCAKYIPQLHMNYSRKSTGGWSSVAFPLLDLLCGVLTVLEMILVSTNYGNWVAFRVNSTELGIAIFSITFSSMFLVQHYVLYPPKMEYDTLPILGTEKGENRTIQGTKEDEDVKSLEEGNALKTFSKEK